MHASAPQASIVWVPANHQETSLMWQDVGLVAVWGSEQSFGAVLGMAYSRH
jgi:hypothetical protein